MQAPVRPTVVIKVGTSSLLRAEADTLNLSNLAGICETVHTLRSDGYKVVLVSSGAIGVGCLRLKLPTRPKALAQKQALAALGQVYLMRYYEDFLEALGLRCAQVLLTLDNLANRNQYLNARNTFAELFNYGAVPIVNENDTVAVEELLARFGDNDTLSAQVATLVSASWLFLLTDVEALYSANPQTDPSAKPIREVHDIMQLQADVSSKGTQWGTGGMATKLAAARVATAAGCHTVVCQTTHPQAIHRILQGARDVGTVFHSHPRLNKGRKRWIPAVPVKGELWLDAGAYRAVLDWRTSLFSAGIIRVVGCFAAQDAVKLCTADGREFARGLCNYAHDEVARIKGKSSKDFVEELGYLGPPEIIHRDNISYLALGERSRSIVASLHRHGAPNDGSDLTGAGTALPTTEAEPSQPGSGIGLDRLTGAAAAGINAGGASLSAFEGARDNHAPGQGTSRCQTGGPFMEARYGPGTLPSRSHTNEAAEACSLSQQLSATGSDVQQHPAHRPYRAQSNEYTLDDGDSNDYGSHEENIMRRLALLRERDEATSAHANIGGNTRAQHRDGIGPGFDQDWLLAVEQGRKDDQQLQQQQPNPEKKAEDITLEGWMPT